MYRDKTIGVVVLAYNVEAHIGDVLTGMPAYVDAVYVVDDGSADRTGETVRQWSVRDARVRLIAHETNIGPGAALSTGYERAVEAGMDVVVKVDGDNQMPLEEMSRLLDPVTAGDAGYAKGNRLLNAAYRANMPRFRFAGNTMLTWLTRVASGNWRVNDPQNGYTAISRDALKAIGWNLYPYYGYLNQILVRLHAHGLKVADVPMVARYGHEKSSIRLYKYVPKVGGLMLRLYLLRMCDRVFRGQTQAVVLRAPRVVCQPGVDKKTP
ncbi:MAG: glycosyltransferase family 2 protein [Dehalococcoidia bacterium]|jgi:glycosyltransferase involved in cell wall biosynthesis|nr:glycosyltransferase family 2 protein [Dehalococcoidia bacterium]